jgi:hypothetical protein
MQAPLPQDIKSEYPVYPGYPPLYPSHQYPRAAYPLPHHLQPQQHQFPAAFGGPQSYPYPSFSQGEAHYQLSSRWGQSDAGHPASYQVKTYVWYYFGNRSGLILKIHEHI